MSVSRFQARLLPPHIPSPSHRHGAPSGPWPWMDLECEVEPTLLQQPRDSHEYNYRGLGHHWAGYPQSLFPNWNPEQLRRSGIAKAIGEEQEQACITRHVDVSDNGRFSDSGRHTLVQQNQEEFWTLMQKTRPEHIRVRGLFVENLSGPVLQMLGTKYNIEPFFFSSSLNWIPSRYQESYRPMQGDHITITLAFRRTMQYPLPLSSSSSSTNPSSIDKMAPPPDGQVIDAQAPLVLRSIQRILLPDLLAIHMIRVHNSSTIISYHPHPAWMTTSAKRLHSRVQYAGQSVYWQNIFQKSKDPTFVLLAVLWHAIYAWDETFESLYTHISSLESLVITAHDEDLTRELYIIRASLLHYSSLLEDFRKSILFVLNTPNPAMDTPSCDDSEREFSRKLMIKECNNLLSEIERLQMSRSMQDQRLGNVMDLVFATVNMGDSNHMQKLTEATLRDSSVIKQISYLTMIFLPASLVATAFGMNIKEIVPGTYGSFVHFIVTVIALTIVTICIIMMFRKKDHLSDPGTRRKARLCWGLPLVDSLLRRRPEKENGEVP